jgi:hypothetical protein
VAGGAPCQDRETFRLVDDAEGGEVAIGIVCDGAGSAAFADAGAELVSNALRTLAASFIAEYGSAHITPLDMREWVANIRRHVCELAEAEGTESRDYACTLLFAIASEGHTICGQIGDGAIVLKETGGLRVAIWPENGEYANETFFVTQDDAEERLQVAMGGPVSDFVVFSDGLQRLALNDALRTAHAGFFEPLVSTVRLSEELDATKSQLEAFLQSERVNEKTDDDKSIVIACRIG